MVELNVDEKTHFGGPENQAKRLDFLSKVLGAERGIERAAGQ